MVKLRIQSTVQNILKWFDYAFSYQNLYLIRKLCKQQLDRQELWKSTLGTQTRAKGINQSNGCFGGEM